VLSPDEQLEAAGQEEAIKNNVKGIALSAVPGPREAGLLAKAKRVIDATRKNGVVAGAKQYYDEWVDELPFVNGFRESVATSNATVAHDPYGKGFHQTNAAFSFAGDASLLIGGWELAKAKVTGLLESKPKVSVSRGSPRRLAPIEESLHDGGVPSSDIKIDRHGRTTNGTYTLGDAGMAKHTPGTAPAGKSVFFPGINAEKIVLDAAKIADEQGLWKATSPGAFPSVAKVLWPEEVGVTGETQQRTNWINLYRKKSGTLHGSPGNPPH
jgi:hypothetical protein